MTDAHGAVAQPTIILVTGGDPDGPARVPGAGAAGAVVVAADSGLDRAFAAGLEVHHVVGDLDSVSAASLRAAEAAGAVIHRHPADKDATDLELAVDLAVDHLVVPDRPTRLLVVGPGGGRLDHLLADLLVLAGPRLAAVEVTARLGPATVTVVRPGPARALRGTPGEQVSLLPVHGAAGGVATQGLRWALVDADLVPGTTRGLSNELVEPVGRVRIDRGVLVAVQPGTVAAPVPPRTTAYDPSPRATPGGAS